MTENFETDYQSSLLNTPYSAVSSGAAITGSNLPGEIGEDHLYFNYNNYFDDNGFSMTGNPYASSPDVISPPISYEVKPPINSDHFWKFGEGKTLKVVEDYIKGTYNGHYASDKSKVQVLDMIDAIDDGVPFCRDNLIKYSSRFGKKDGMSKLDALKIIHYGILLYHFAGFNNETQKSNYETF
ncbi:MAG: DUF3310 domain-containing protein [Nitrosarchaeum sp.]|nr:DUF3310 domain-containing protein [Nitrosarchaeum sp.]